MTEQEVIKYLKGGCLGLNCEYHIKDRCKDDFEAREKKKADAIILSIKALEEVQQYRALGGTPELIGKIIHFLCDVGDNSIIKDLELLNQYKLLGTVEELKDAKEKQIAKKPIWKTGDFINRHHCPCCNEIVWIEHPYCECGQKLDWGNEDDRD